eukprot:15456917-Alexandrium_andersonii.AAC.1
MARRALQIQRAVRRCPRHPSFEGLDLMLSFQLDESGGIVTSKFDAFVAEEQKSRAQILKQERMWTEERDAEDRKYKGRDQDGNPNNPTPKKKGGGRGSGDQEPAK